MNDPTTTRPLCTFQDRDHRAGRLTCPGCIYDSPWEFYALTESVWQAMPDRQRVSMLAHVGHSLAEDAERKRKADDKARRDLVGLVNMAARVVENFDTTDVPLAQRLLMRVQLWRLRRLGRRIERG